MVNDVQGPVFAQGDGAGPGEEIAPTLLGFHEDAKREPGEVIARQPRFGGQVAVGVELGKLGALSGLRIVAQLA